MKKISKVLSIVLTLITVLSVMVLPVAAAELSDSKATWWVTRELTDAENGVYKITINLDANYPVSVGDVVVYYNKADFKHIRNTGVAGTTPSARNAVTWLGDFADNEEYADTDFDEGYVLGAGKSDKAAVVSPAAKYFDDTISSDVYGGCQLYWLSGGENHYYYDSSRNGTAIAELYVQALTDTADIKTVGLLKAPSSCAYNLNQYDKTTAAAELYQADANNTLTFSSVEVVEASEQSPVYAKTSQVRYNSAETNGKGTANFDVRTRAALSVDDFNSLCTYDAATKATNIDKVGFVYADSTVGLTLDNAAKVIGGTAVAGYVDVPVEHIQKTSTEYVWTCLIEDAAYADAVDSVGYIVVNGTTYYFDAVYATDFSDLYDAQSSHIPTA